MAHGLAARNRCWRRGLTVWLPSTPDRAAQRCHALPQQRGMYMKLYRICSASALALTVFVSAGTALADPKGLWLAQDGARVKVGPCGGALCATIATPKSAVDPETGRPWTDKNNPDPAQRGRPLVGVPVLYGLVPDGPGRWSGRLYNVDNGNSYVGHLLELGPTTIRVEGCAIGICGGQNMTRIK
jgi:uncharacterized protein (DUF2147 family)